MHRLGEGAASNIAFGTQSLGCSTRWPKCTGWVWREGSSPICIFPLGCAWSLQPMGDDGLVIGGALQFLLDRDTLPGMALEPA